MIKPDVIVAWPLHLDYPLFRKYIHDHRDKLAKVLIVFTQMNSSTGDYTAFVKGEMAEDDITFLDNDPVTAKDDWRDIAVNKALKESGSGLVWFTEQDFQPQKGFWNEVESLLGFANVLSYFQDGRMHPCCIITTRDIIEKTTKNFGVVRDKLDHFGVFQKDIEKLSYDTPGEEVAIGMLNPECAVHLNGLSQNLYLLQTDQEPNYDIPAFKKYCQDCLDTDVKIHPDFRKLFSDYLKG